MATLLGVLPIQIPIRSAPTAVLEWIAAHPGQTALLVANGVIIFTPAALTGPLLAAMGFGAQGPVAGSIAVWLQSALGNVGACSLFAYLQSAAMGGYGAAVANGVVQAGAVLVGFRWASRMRSGLRGLLVTENLDAVAES